MSTMMDRLLSMEMPEPETAKKRLKRLGLELTLKELSYNQIAGVTRGEEPDVQLLLEGVVDPDFRAPEWYKERMGCPTPAEAVKRLLKPGEIRQVARALDKLAGFDSMALEDITKN